MFARRIPAFLLAAARAGCGAHGALGSMNGDLFKSVLAFSPGFAAPTFQTGAPRVFVSHGTDDRVLPIARCSRSLVPALRRRGLDVDYRESAGAHAVPKELALEGARRFLGARAPCGHMART